MDAAVVMHQAVQMRALGFRLLHCVAHHDESGPVFLEDMEARFATMKAAGVPSTERAQSQTW